MIVIEKVSVSWTKVGEAIDALVEQIIASDQRFDRVVGISRGGLVPGVALSHKLNIPFTVVGVSSYNNETHEQQTLICDTPDVVFEGWEGNILVVDDLVDSGTTMQFLLDKIAENKKVKNTSIATLYYKKTSIIKPDFYVEATDKWIVFSWENSSSELK